MLNPETVQVLDWGLLEVAVEELDQLALANVKRGDQVGQGELLLVVTLNEDQIALHQREVTIFRDGWLGGAMKIEI